MRDEPGPEPVAGSLLITSPEGTAKVLDFGELVPDIQNKSSIEVLQGQMKLTVTEEDSAVWTCGGNTGTVSGGASVSVSCGDASGLLEVLEGEVSYTDAEGVTHTVKAGEQVNLKVLPKTAPPAAAASNQEGNDPVDSNVEPDSRSIEASVSQ